MVKQVIKKLISWCDYTEKSGGSRDGEQGIGGDLYV